MRLSVSEIQRIVCDHFRIRQSEMVGPRRNRDLARPRQIAMAMAREYTTLSLPQIGCAFGGRDHTTAIHAIRKVAELSEQDEGFRANVRDVRRVLDVQLARIRPIDLTVFGWAA